MATLNNGASTVKTEPLGSSSSEALVEDHGVCPIPARDRTSGGADQFWIWAGANLAPINWVLGTVGLGLGLSLAETLIVILVGNMMGSALFGLFCIMGHKTGVNAMILARLALGRRGAKVVAAVMVLMPMGWVGVNTWIVLDLAMTALKEVGVQPNDTVKYSIAAVIMIIQVLLAAWGFNAIKKFERWTMPVILVVMVVMTIVASLNVHPSFAPGTLDGTDKLAAMSQVMTAIGIGWGITWFVYAADFTRFTRPTMPTKKVFWSATLGMFVPVVWLGFLGAYIASAGGGTDPAELVLTAFGALALPILVLILHGPIATNIVVMYSSVLAVLSLDIRARQWKIALGGGIVGSFVLWLFLQSENFANSAAQWMSVLVLWISPWAAMTLVDFFILRRQRVDVSSLYAAPSVKWSRDVNWPGVVSLAAGLLAGWLFLKTGIPGVEGPLAIALGGTDLSWLSSSIVAGTLYYFLGHKNALPATVPSASTMTSAE
ncbi:cytosine permease [Arthrobacter sp. AK01]|uniref:purine-cytosine permease family protein n=1 Tax=Micrococcaceae TaxID=1268 RepID=UPI001E637A95|nr:MULTISPECIES: cytosine permease [Micrococcaceae]MCD4849993.1 cytosine permease [Arthrobacter sp. AK01]MCP1412171.1 NCS1 nucleoside transporter family [Paenarthrobacter sp. A20]